MSCSSSKRFYSRECSNDCTHRNDENGALEGDPSALAPLRLAARVPHHQRSVPGACIGTASSGRTQSALLAAIGSLITHTRLTGLNCKYV